MTFWILGILRDIFSGLYTSTQFLLDCCFTEYSNQMKQNIDIIKHIFLKSPSKPKILLWLPSANLQHFSVCSQSKIKRRCSRVWNRVTLFLKYLSYQNLKGYFLYGHLKCTIHFVFFSLFAFSFFFNITFVNKLSS